MCLLCNLMVMKCCEMKTDIHTIFLQFQMTLLKISQLNLETILNSKRITKSNYAN